ncbi:MAG TPA: ATP-binding protein [Armatimonadota bacterium]|nr:ATP-binding protein [Armatimonadota bacterium]
MAKAASMELSTRSDGTIQPFALAPTPRAEIGMVVSGSLLQGLDVKLAASQEIEDLRAGTFIVVDGARHQFFCMIIDVRLAATNDQILGDPPRGDETLLREALAGTATYGGLAIRPMLMLPRDAVDLNEPDNLMPVKTIPAHFSPAFHASEDDVNRVFGAETADGAYFRIGAPLDMDVPVCINLERFVERSNGVFGKSGAGKTFLTRILLCGIIRSRRAVSLIFDMHNEYGDKASQEDAQQTTVWGLRRYFQERVSVFTLDRESTLRRKATADYEVIIPFSRITVEDITLLQDELNLPPTASETSSALESFYGDQWFEKLVTMDREELKQLAEETTRLNVNHGALRALQRRLQYLASQCGSFLKATSPDDPVKRIMETLQKGIHVVLEFGLNTKPLQYMLVANILTRLIHEEYIKRMETALGDESRKPMPLVIVIEEAHKFLSPNLSRQTIFGTIAREMRKFNVTLLVVDQRPSGIDNEVLSQLGTRITCLLNDERDIDAVLVGMRDASGLKGILATLDSKEQALVMGHAVPMPVVVKTRKYDDGAFRREMQPERPARQTFTAEEW